MPDSKAVASKCLQAWANGDFDTARSLIDDEITFAGPFGTAQGADAYLDGLRRFRDRGVETAEIQRAFQDSDQACLIYNLVTNTAAGTIPRAGTSSAAESSFGCAHSSIHIPWPHRR